MAQPQTIWTGPFDPLDETSSPRCATPEARGVRRFRPRRLPQSASRRCETACRRRASITSC